jgi:DNA-directed RNA polymerase subunit RPC12/RpoP
MQIEANRTMCPVCDGARLEVSPLFHHMICAYVGPAYDFTVTAAGYACPKCRHDIMSTDGTCEIVGTSARCSRCGREMIVSPPGK